MQEAKDVVSQYQRKKTGRSTWEAQWREAARYILPDQVDKFFGGHLSTHGGAVAQDIFDPTAMLAAPKFAAAIQDLTTPAGSRWHKLRSRNRQLMQVRAIAEYFELVTEIIFDHRYKPQANFASQRFSQLLSIAAYGNGYMFIDKHPDGGLRYRHCHVTELTFSSNHAGIIDTAFRTLRLTARQAAQEFGLENLSRRITEAHKRPEDETLFEFVHHVCPNNDYDKRRVDIRGARYSSGYYEVESPRLIPNTESGFRSFPYSLARYILSPLEDYGRGPAQLCMSSILVLQQLTLTLLKQGHRAADPVLFTHDDGTMAEFGMAPGTVNMGGMNKDGRMLVGALPVGQTQITEQLIQDTRGILNDAFLISLFQVLVDKGSDRMTAYEVAQRVQEKSSLLAPTVGRMQADDLGPMIEREIELLADQGLLPPPPQELIDARETEYTIEYESPVARLAENEKVQGFTQSFQMAVEAANVMQDPSVLDAFDVDTAISEIAVIRGAPVRWMRGPMEIKQIRKDRQQAQATQQALDAAPAVAQTLKVVNDANTAGR